MIGDYFNWHITGQTVVVV